MSASMPWTDETYYRLSDIQAAVGVNPEDTLRRNGVVYFNGVEQAALDAAVAAADPLGQLRYEAIERVKRGCKLAILKGQRLNGDTLPLEETDQLNLASVCILAVWKKFKDEDVEQKLWVHNSGWHRKTFTRDQLIALGEAVVTAIQAYQERYETLMNQALAATTAESLEAIEWS